MSASPKREARQKVAGRKAAERARKRGTGLQRVELWAHPDDAKELRRLAGELTDARSKRKIAVPSEL